MLGAYLLGAYQYKRLGAYTFIRRPIEGCAMRLQKHGSRVRKGKEYFKWTLVVPPEEIEALGWEEGQELKPKRDGKRLIIEKDS